MEQCIEGIYISGESLVKLSENMEALNALVEVVSNTKNSKEFRNFVIKIGYVCGSMNETVETIIKSTQAVGDNSCGAIWFSADNP